MAAHSKGPWMAAACNSSVVGLPIVAQPSGRSIANVTFFNLGKEFGNHDRESVANANLISAAPDLYAALERAEAWFRARLEGRATGGSTGERLDDVVSALAKARGEAPPLPMPLEGK